MKHTNSELKQWQALPLDVKVTMTKSRIRSWVHEYGTEGVYVSFSGGKDSTVLLHLVRQEFDDVVGVFCDTSLEYPEIREFVKGFDNIVWLKPKKNFKQVINDYGYPFISKEIAGKVHEAKSKRGGYAWRVFHGSKKGTPYDLQKWKWILEIPYKLGNHCCYVMKNIQ